MLVTIRPAPGGIGGVIATPPSNSMAHRAVLCAALAVGRSHISLLDCSKDISATLSAAAQLCAAVDTGADDATVQGLGHFLPLTAPVDCCESCSPFSCIFTQNCLEYRERGCETVDNSSLHMNMW